MPRFFFDLYDESSRSADEFGDTFESAAEAADQATSILIDMLRNDLPCKPAQSYKCSVRDETGTVVYEASLSLTLGAI